MASGCPEGKWTLSNAELAEFWNVIQAESGPGADFTVAGSVVLDLNADKSLAWTFQDYSVTLSVAGVASVTQIEGAITGQWSSDDKTLTATNLLDDTSATLTVNGVEQPGAAAIGEQIIANFPIENVTYSCEGSDLIVDSPTVDGTKKLTLTPA